MHGTAVDRLPEGEYALGPGEVQIPTDAELAIAEAAGDRAALAGNL